MTDFWVVGSNGNIGSLLVRRLTEAGHEVVGLDMQDSSNAELQNFEYRKFELDDLEALEQNLKTLPTPRLGFAHLSGLTGNPDEDGWLGGIEHQTLKVWQKTLNVNLSSAFLFSRELARRTSQDSSPSAPLSIVLTSSIYGSLGPNPSLYPDGEMPNPASYGVSKAGLEGLARYITTTSGGHIRANTVAPGGIFRGQNQAFIEKYTSRTPLGRMANESDVVELITFLLSEKSSYIAGQNIPVDGGFTSW